MNYTVKFLTFLILISLPLASMSADRRKGEDKPYVTKIGLEETINSEGIKVKLFKDAVAKPLPAIENKKIQNGKGEKFDVYNPAELWLHDQYVGSWGSNQDMISIIKMTLPPPTGVRSVFQGLVLKDDYGKWKNEAKPDWNDTLVAEWIKQIGNGKLKDAKGEAIQKDIQKKNKISRYYTGDATEDATRRIYTAVCSDRPNDRYVIIYELGRNADIEKGSKVILQSLQSLTFFPPKKTDDKDKQMTTTKTVKKKDYSDEYIQSKEKVIQNIRNLKDWWYLETESFIIVSNLKNKKTINDLQLNLEKSRSAFVKFYPLKAPLKAVSVCKVFESRDEYISYIPSEMKWSAGIWMADKKELAISPMNWGSQSDNRKIMIDIAFHEGFHQYIFYAANENHSAAWFNEGNACFFEGIDFKSGNKVKIDLTNRAEQMKKLAGGNFNIENFIHLGYQQFYGNKETSYSLAWGLIFFLQKGAPVMKEKNNYAEIPAKYYDALIELKDEDKATDKAWEGVDFKKFSRNFEEFWKSDTMIKRAEMYDPLEAREKNAPKSTPAAPANPATVPAVK
ncbi:MAG TPA: hypothetical protein DET40_09460 [Lentisphaeria bacterium]|nr:MAG: hypothetical protein A2X45_08250 [Lentisphaerae bacterium GWF2_50_93]HCE43763.1 hypothetical protein [Lentisphaeria bacterium]